MKTNEAVARRWLASKHWGGARVGMVRADGKVVLGESRNKYVQEVRLEGVGWVDLCDDWIFDLDHPGTRAFLLEDVRRSWGRAVSVVMPCDGRPEFAVEIEHADEWPCYWDRYTGPSEAEALIAALEAAP